MKSPRPLYSHSNPKWQICAGGIFRREQEKVAVRSGTTDKTLDAPVSFGSRRKSTRPQWVTLKASNKFASITCLMNNIKAAQFSCFFLAFSVTQTAILDWNDYKPLSLLRQYGFPAIKVSINRLSGSSAFPNCPND